MQKIMARLTTTCIVVALPLLPLGSCAGKTNKAPDPAVEVQEPMAWPQTPVLSCQARIAYTQQFLWYFKEGLPEDRIIIASDWESSQERAEILEIRRRVYHDQGALQEVTTCVKHEET